MIKFNSVIDYEVGNKIYDDRTGELYKVIDVSRVWIHEHLKYAITAKLIDTNKELIIKEVVQ